MKHSSEKQANILTNDQLSKLVIPDIDEEKLQKQPDFYINNQKMEKLDLPEIQRINSDFSANNLQLDQLNMSDIENKINDLQKIKKFIQKNVNQDNNKEFSETLNNNTEIKGRTR